MLPSPARAERLAALRAAGAGARIRPRADRRDMLPFGIEAVDSRLAGGGLPSPRCTRRRATRRPGRRGRRDPVPRRARRALRRPGEGGRCSGRSPAATCSRRASPRPASTPDRLLYAECRQRRGGARGDGGGAAPRRPRRGGRRGRGAPPWPPPAGSSSPPRRAAALALLLRRWRKADVDPLGAPVAGAHPLADRLRPVRAFAA